jgi:hypothetical protein
MITPLREGLIRQVLNIFWTFLPQNTAQALLALDLTGEKRTTVLPAANLSTPKE